MEDAEGPPAPVSLVGTAPPHPYPGRTPLARASVLVGVVRILRSSHRPWWRGVCLAVWDGAACVGRDRGSDRC